MSSDRPVSWAQRIKEACREDALSNTGACLTTYAEALTDINTRDDSQHQEMLSASLAFAAHSPIYWRDTRQVLDVAMRHKTYPYLWRSSQEFADELVIWAAKELRKLSTLPPSGGSTPAAPEETCKWISDCLLKVTAASEDGRLEGLSTQEKLDWVCQTSHLACQWLAMEPVGRMGNRVRLGKITRSADGAVTITVREY